MDDYESEPASYYIDFKTGITTGDNIRFTRLWYELNKKSTKWIFLRSGANYRKWYGCLLDKVLWENDGDEIKHMKGATLRNMEYQFKPCATWSKISSGNVSMRYSPQEVMFDAVGLCAFSSKQTLYYCLALMNCSVGNFFLRITNASMSILTSDLGKVPFKIENENEVETLVSQNISISKSDWDAHETSWDFEENELVRFSKEQGEGPHRLSDLMEAYKAHWTEQFLQLHANEEELNRQFIEIYGLEDELTPDVPPEEITILQQGEICIENGQIVWQNDVIVKQLISYAVGCMLGRYRLDKLGLHIAHPEPTAEETAPYTFNGQQWNIDEDGILPLMPSDTDFADNATVMFKRWLVVTFGEDTLVDNLNCVEAALGKSLDDYFVKDFWKDHKKMYQNRPIYWLFSSKKGAFQCLAYMHRMNAYTAERIRTKYLLPHIEWLVQKQSEMEANAANLNARERKQLDSITRQIAECREYHDCLHTVADEQIAFDLDDGVVVNYAKFGDVLAKLK